MPAIRATQQIMPAWCEVEAYEIVRLSPGDVHAFPRRGEKEKLFVGQGTCRVIAGSAVYDASRGDEIDLPPTGESFEACDVEEDTVLIRVCGRWGEKTGGSGVFTLDNSETPRNIGDPVDYPRTTDFDNHYHDCDE